MRGNLVSASQNESKPIFKYPKYSNIMISENFLASDLLFAMKSTAGGEPSNTYRNAFTGGKRRKNIRELGEAPSCEAPWAHFLQLSVLSYYVRSHISHVHLYSGVCKENESDGQIDKILYCKYNSLNSCF